MDQAAFQLALLGSDVSSTMKSTSPASGKRDSFLARAREHSNELPKKLRSLLRHTSVLFFHSSFISVLTECTDA